MKYIVEKLTKSEELESKIKVLCSFKSIKFNIKQGRIISIENTNISFIVPHKIILDKNKYKFYLRILFCLIDFLVVILYYIIYIR